jgi:hypothetical protein
MSSRSGLLALSEKIGIGVRWLLFRATRSFMNSDHNSFFAFATNVERFVRVAAWRHVKAQALSAHCTQLDNIEGLFLHLPDADAVPSTGNIRTRVWCATTWTSRRCSLRRFNKHKIKHIKRVLVQ